MLKQINFLRYALTKVAYQLIIVGVYLYLFSPVVLANSRTKERILTTLPKDSHIQYFWSDETKLNQPIVVKFDLNTSDGPAVATTATLLNRVTRMQVLPIESVEFPQWENQLEDINSVELNISAGIEEPYQIGIKPGVPPDPQADRLAKRQFNSVGYNNVQESNKDNTTSTKDIPLGMSMIFTRYRGNYHLAMWRNLPWSAVGKLYFYIPSYGEYFYCSAAVIGPQQIVTAAHCLASFSETNALYSDFHTQVVFVPAERLGWGPYGYFHGIYSLIPFNYMKNAAISDDIGIVVLDNNTLNYPVSYYTGYLGYTWNQPYVNHLHAIGYADELSRHYSMICAAESLPREEVGINILGMGCDMTFGSSGGPWIKDYSPYEYSGNYITSVVSGGVPWIPTFYGARFTSNNIVPLCQIAGCQ
ncbi:MAG: S1 family peptidase [Thioploca sp.]|nr:S1 family peptidase [Thioploca sp.]